MTAPTETARSILLRLVLPEQCSLCHQPSRFPVCAACRAELPWNRIACPLCARPQDAGTGYICGSCAQTPPPFDSGWSAFRYATPIDQAVQGLKYRAGFRSGRWLGQEMAQALARRSRPLPELLLPVPLHAGRLRRRGYNQALELARALGQTLSIEVAPQLARRLRATEDQIGKSAAERRRNIKGAFAVEAGRLDGRHIALVDDVMTTGSTLAELARVCRKAGAARIEVWTAARAV
ncbi:MAG TPA: ComF family protein [Nevskia sp.]|nr:ComF family protein [Nevskia sp.]